MSTAKNQTKHNEGPPPVPDENAEAGRRMNNPRMPVQGSNANGAPADAEQVNLVDRDQRPGSQEGFGAGRGLSAKYDKGTTNRIQSVKSIRIQSQERPSHEKLLDHLNRTHPRNEKGDAYACCEACCFPTGENCLCKTAVDQKVDQFGLGVSLYFKFLKSVLWMLFAVIVINSFLFVIFKGLYDASGEDSLFAVGGEDETFSMKLKKFWTQTSLGGFAAASNRFFEAEIQDTSQELILTCPKGNFSVDPDVTYFGVISDSDFAIYTMFMIDKTCNNNDVFDNRIKNCENKAECKVSFDKTWFKDNCLPSSAKKLYLKMYCKETTLTVFGKTYTKQDYSFLIVCVGMGTLLFYIIFLLAAKVNESKLKKHFQKHKASPSDFALQLKSLPDITDEQQMIGTLYNHLSEFAKAEKMDNPIIDISVGQQNETFIINKQINEANEMLSYEYDRLKNKKYFKGKKLGEHPDMTQLKDEIKKLKKPKDRESANRVLKKMIKHAKEKKKAITHQKDLQKEENKIKRAFVTFQTIDVKNIFVEKLKSSSCQRCCLRGKKAQEIFDIRRVKGQVMKVSQPPQPINMKWQNMTYTGKSKCTRRTISWLLTILLFLIFVAITILISVGITNNETKKRDCPKSSDALVITKVDALADYVAGDTQSLVYCYCVAEFTTRLNEQFDVNGKNEKLCHDIYTAIGKQLLLAMLIAFCLTCASMIIDKFLKFLSAFEKYTDLNEEFTSRVYKGFLLKYLNSGFLILLLNLRVRITSNLSLGRYDDLTPSWYATIGYSVIFTFCLKFISLVVWTIYRWWVPGVTKCCDRSCSCDIKKTKTKTMADYIAVYMGREYDIDFSYTEILKTVLICMTFGSILPIIYVIAFIHLLFLYWRDKLLLLTNYRVPPYFDNRINQKAREILTYGIPIFCFACIWSYGNPNVLEKTNIISFDAAEFTSKITNENLDSFLGPLVRFFDRATNVYGLVFFAILILCAVYIILKFVFVNILGFILKILFGCCKVEGKQAKVKDDQKFDGKVQEGEMKDDIDLYTILDEKVKNKDKKLVDLTQKRHKFYKRRMAMVGKTTSGVKSVKFSTLASYNFRLNPLYIDYFFKNEEIS